MYVRLESTAYAPGGIMRPMSLSMQIHSRGEV